jgi:predicted nucleic acid-binding Zn ribbon protein
MGPNAVPARPRIADEPGILGLSRRSRGRLGSRMFTWFFVLVFALILVQMVMSILYPW